MKKILDFIIIFLLLFLIISLFNRGEKDTVETEKSSIVFEVLETSYTVPAWIKLEIENKTEKDLEIDVCNDLQVKYIQSDALLEFDDNFCDNNIVTIKKWSKSEIDYSSVYENFKEKWNYIIKASLDWKNLSSSFEVEPRGTFTKLFIYLFYAPAYNLIIFLSDILNWSFGWAIIAITILLRILLLWPQHKMLVSQKKLQNIQPKIKKIQEEFKWKPQVLGQKMMELYKVEKVNPVWSCGFLLVQMPVLLVIYNVILHIEDNSNAYYLYSFLSDFNLSFINYSFYGLDLLWSGWVSWIILWLTVWLLQFIQIKLSYKNNPIVKKDSVVLEKKSWSKDYSSMMPDPAVMQKFMLYWMPIMVAIFTYNFPAGLWLYWGISTSFMIIQQLIVNRIKK